LVSPEEQLVAQKRHMNVGLIVLLVMYLMLQVLVAFFLIQPFLLLLIYAVGRMMGVRPPATPRDAVTKDYRFGILITAHRVTDFIPPIIDSLLKQTYSAFNVYVVADDCDISQLHFTDPRVNILVPPFPLNNQTASLQFGFRHFDERDEVLVIFDPDNLVHPNFLQVLNAWYNKGYRAVQGNLQSKNKEGIYAQIDSLGMFLGNFVERDMRSMLGLSVNIWGCGVSVHREVYQNIIYDAKSRMGGFDKHMQAEIVKDVDRIAYARSAIVYDEKVDDAYNFERQRIRWIAAYFKFLGKAFGVLFAGLRKRDFNLVYFGLNLIRLPYFLLLIMAVCIAMTDWPIDPPLTEAWALILGFFTLSFTVIVLINTAGRSVAKSIWYIPLVFYHQLRALFKLRIHKKSLLKTEHTKVLYIDEILGNTRL
jgi:cellulose synthase/poly-beta-1,6-N-acetylglucosamine synthase-like glycosyltransferase